MTEKSYKNQSNETLVSGCDDVKLVVSDNEMEKLVIDNPFAYCEVYLQGAHVTDFTPKDEQPLLWISKDANFITGKAIRGGIPICWPWFGPSPDSEVTVAHGFARTKLWQLQSVDTDNDGFTHINLQLTSDDQTRQLWPFEFSLLCLITVGKELTVSLTTQNLDKKDMQISEAIHTYFAVPDIAQVSVTNLDSNPYLDKLANNAEIMQQGDVTISEATDRIYTHSANEQIIVDKGANRQIKVTKAGANDTVVWNPWIDIAKGMADFDDLGYKQMLCVEAVNSQVNPVTIKAGQSHTTSQTLSVVEQ